MEGAIAIVCEGATWKKSSLLPVALIQKLSKPADASSIARGDGGKHLKGRRHKTKLKKVLCPKSERERFFCTSENQPRYFSRTGAHAQLLLLAAAL